MPSLSIRESEQEFSEEEDDFELVSFDKDFQISLNSVKNPPGMSN